MILVDKLQIRFWLPNLKSSCVTSRISQGASQS